VVLSGQEGNGAAEPPPFQFERCPCKAKLGDQATVDLLKGFVFIDQANAGKFLEWNHNIPDGDELGIVASERDNWFVVYSFLDIGYVKDEEKSNLDADALLKSMTDSTEAANDERRKRGWGTMKVVGWQEKPHYEQSSHNLEWSVVGENESGGRTINHNSRFLGRRGVISANLVASPDTITQDVATFRSYSTGFSFTPNNKYTAFVKGDKVAEYGLTALILGGAAGAAAKTGLLKSAIKLAAAFWKLIILAVAGLVGTLGRLFRRRQDSREAAEGS
jgi:uncharacterized membrane-anchored protein